MSLLFGLADVRVESVVPLPDGTREVHVRNASEVAAGCPSLSVLYLGEGQYDDVAERYSSMR
jgi:hypothetical protein